MVLGPRAPRRAGLHKCSLTALGPERLIRLYGGSLCVGGGSCGVVIRALHYNPGQPGFNSWPRCTTPWPWVFDTWPSTLLAQLGLDSMQLVQCVVSNTVREGYNKGEGMRC